MTMINAPKYYIKKTEKVSRIEDDSTIGVMGQWDNPTKERISRKLLRSVELVAEEALQIPFPNILDIGCFTGYTYDWLVKYIQGDFKYLGIDIDAEAIEIATKTHNAKPIYRTHDLYGINCPFADIAICSRVLIHVPDFRKALEKILTAAPVAVISLSFSDRWQIIKKTVGMQDQSPDGVYYHRYVTTANLEKMFNELGIVCSKIPNTTKGTHSMVIRNG